MTITAEVTLGRKLAKVYEYERGRYENFLREVPVPYRLPRCWDGGAEGNPESRGASVWVRLARLCRRRQIDPVGYVQWSLSIEQLGLDRPPEPNQLLAPGRLDAYAVDRAKAAWRASVALRVQRQVAQNQISYYAASGRRTMDDACAIVLLDDGLNLSSLFRYCLARSIGGERFLKIADLYEGGALLQYQRNRTAYDAAWKRMQIPPGFAERAARFYDYVLDSD